MNVIYISFLNEDIRPGYKLKIHSQAKAFYKLGMKCYLYIVNNQGVVLYEIGEQERIVKVYKPERKRKNLGRNIRDEFFLFQFFANNLNSVMKQLNPQLVYIRRIVPLNPIMIKMLKDIKKHSYIVYEYPTYPWREEMLKAKQYLFYGLDRMFFNRLLDKVDCIAYIGDASDVKLKYKHKFLEIQNGVEVDNYKEYSKVREKNEPIVFVGVAHVAHYHGYDRVIRGMNDYYSKNPKQKVYFHIVGEVNEKLGLQELVENLSLKDAVFFHGMKVGDELDKIFEKADIGVGTLSYHRIDVQGIMTDNSLKSREYIARGIPLICAIRMGFEKEGENLDFIIHCEKGEEPIKIEEVLNKYNSIKNSPEQIRDYAKQNLSWEKQIKKIIKVFENI